MLLCCGFFIDTCAGELDTADICGCPNGVDGSVIHDGDMVRLITQTGKEIIQYRETVFCFVDKVEAFYRQSPPRSILSDEIDREGYAAFWREWYRRRTRA